MVALQVQDSFTRLPSVATDSRDSQESGFAILAATNRLVSRRVNRLDEAGE
jgi:hypothetical protein